jgi:NAD-dependent SIR2 family protein deacetylase
VAYYDVTKDDLTKFNCRRVGYPHVVILGAGASLAACPNGDVSGKRLPLMANMVEVLGLQDLITGYDYDTKKGFESLYSNIHATDSSSPVLRKIEQRVNDYFSQLELPPYPTIYDYLLRFLRPKDAIFTFNWDPFLVNAYNRNWNKIPLPNIFHLHGNVCAAYCERCDLSIFSDSAISQTQYCSECGKDVVPTQLLYPVEKKDYAGTPYLRSQWNHFRDYIGRALLVTIFGYSAPTTDQEAITIFRNAWKDEKSHKLVDRLEIIDVKGLDELGRQWGPFALFDDHYDVQRSFFQSWLARYPRRSCEAIFQSNGNGKVVEPIEQSGKLEDLSVDITKLAEYENQPHKS